MIKQLFYSQNAASELDTLDIDLDCSLEGDLGSLAQLMEDLASIIESVGLEKLSEELGINFGSLAVTKVYRLDA